MDDGIFIVAQAGGERDQYGARVISNPLNRKTKENFLQGIGTKRWNEKGEDLGRRMDGEELTKAEKKLTLTCQRNIARRVITRMVEKDDGRFLQELYMARIESAAKGHWWDKVSRWRAKRATSA